MPEYTINNRTHAEAMTGPGPEILSLLRATGE